MPQTKNPFHKKLRAYHTPLRHRQCSQLYTSILGSMQSTAQCHANPCKLCMLPNAACCMTPMHLAVKTAGCTPHKPNLFFMKPPELLQAYYTSTVFDKNSRILEFL